MVCIRMGPVSMGDVTLVCPRRTRGATACLFGLAQPLRTRGHPQPTRPYLRDLLPAMNYFPRDVHRPPMAPSGAILLAFALACRCGGPTAGSGGHSGDGASSEGAGTVGGTLAATTSSSTEAAAVPPASAVLKVADATWFQLLVGNDRVSCQTLPSPAYCAGDVYWFASIPLTQVQLVPGTIDIGSMATSTPSVAPTPFYNALSTGPTNADGVCPDNGGGLLGSLTIVSVDATSVVFNLANANMVGVPGGGNGSYTAVRCE